MKLLQLSYSQTPLNEVLALGVVLAVGFEVFSFFGAIVK